MSFKSQEVGIPNYLREIWKRALDSDLKVGMLLTVGSHLTLCSIHSQWKS